VGAGPIALVYNSTDNKIYCANSASNNVTIIDGAGDSVIAILGVGDYPTALVYNPTNNKIYCANWASDSVTIIDGKGDSVITTVGVGDMPVALAYDSIHNKIYCAKSGPFASVSVINGETNEKIGSMDVESHDPECYSDGVKALVYNPTDNKLYGLGVCHYEKWRVLRKDGTTDNKLYRLGQGYWLPPSYFLAIFDAGTDSQITAIGIHPLPSAIAYNSINDKIYIANPNWDVVTIFDGAGDTMIVDVGVGSDPKALAYNPKENKMYSANSGSRDVSIIDGADDSVIDSSVVVGLSPIALAYNSTNNKIYCANQASSDVSVIDGEGDSVIATVEVGDYPSTLAYNSTDNKIYCANYNDSTVSVIACSPPSAVEEDQESRVIPNFSLKQNYPNPFNPVTSIQYTVGSGQIPIHTTLKIYNILGQRVRTLVDEPKGRGNHEVIWDGKDESGKEVASGIYFYQLKIGKFTETKRMLLLK